MTHPDLMTHLTVPTVHLNGTSRSELARGDHEAYSALARALDLLAETAPHARDYYVQREPNAFTDAIREHGARVQHLQGVQDELLHLFNVVADQGGAR